MQEPEGSVNEIIEQHLPLIEKAVRAVASRRRLSAAESEELRSDVLLKVVRKDCRVLRRFQGRSCIETYLYSVVTRVLLDHRVKEWGRWRASVTAKRLGDVAVKLEELLWRDHYTLDEAVEVLRTHHCVGCSRSELYDLATKLPTRIKRRFNSMTCMDEQQSSTRADDGLRDSQRSSLARSAESALCSAVKRLSRQERQILKLQFEQGQTVADISRSLGVRQRSLYSRVHKILGALRQSLEHRGISRSDVRELCGWRDLCMKVDLGSEESSTRITNAG